jgi:hypothetical protein
VTFDHAIPVKFENMNDTERTTDDAVHDVTESPASTDVERPADEPADHARSREIGGRKGPDPVRYGDWEKNGRCIDF